jgi:formate dehydrogenase
MHPLDAERTGVDHGATVRVTTKRGTVEAILEVTDSMREGHISLPNGLGLRAEDATGTPGPGAAPNELTSAEDHDWLAGTPWHKHVPARVEAVG